MADPPRLVVGSPPANKGGKADLSTVASEVDDMGRAAG